MRRVGYDADTQRYTYQDGDGSYWEEAEGARYERLERGKLVATYLQPLQH